MTVDIPAILVRRRGARLALRDDGHRSSAGLEHARHLQLRAWHLHDASVPTLPGSSRTKPVGTGASGPAFAMAIAALTGAGLLTYQILVKPFQSRKDIILVVVMTTLAGTFFIENTIRLIWGPRLKQIERVVDGTVSLIGVAISAHELVIILLTPAILLMLFAFLKFTRTGSAIRAIAQNQDSALLLGINVPVLYAISFAVSSGLAGLAGRPSRRHSFHRAANGHRTAPQGLHRGHLRRPRQPGGNHRRRLCHRYPRIGEYISSSAYTGPTR